MNSSSELRERAQILYEELGLDHLPSFLRRNSLDYYYLSIYPSLKTLKPLSSSNLPRYPEKVTNAYLHVPFCSGVCEFCSYFLLPVNNRKSTAVARYLELVERELAIHAEKTRIEISYLYFGGGTPSLISPPSLDRLLGFMKRNGFLAEKAMGTMELHPELFDDPALARDLLQSLAQYGIKRVSIGYQESSEVILEETERRHGARFLPGAFDLLRDLGFFVNVDVMYGLPSQTLEDWEKTLRDVTRFEPDSISTYFLFVDPGTGLYKKVIDGIVHLPDHRQIQTQHLMAQIFLEERGYRELPNDFYAKVSPGLETSAPILPSDSHSLPLGPGSYGFYDDTQFCNVFDLITYRARILAGQSPLWRGYHLGADESLHRDVMFSFKNSPWIDPQIFLAKHGGSPVDRFHDEFRLLFDLGLIQDQSSHLLLTPKGRLCVEEIACLFRSPSIEEPTEFGSEKEKRLLDKHNFSPTYPPSRSSASSNPRL